MVFGTSTASEMRMPGVLVVLHCCRHVYTRTQSDTKRGCVFYEADSNHGLVVAPEH